jgi:hypothetical protein
MSRFKGAPLRSAEIADVLFSHRRQGFDHVTLTGGEPTLYPGFLQVLAACKRLGYRTYVTSNGARLADASFAAKALPMIDELCLSVHADNAPVHDGCAGREGSFEAVRAALGEAGKRKDLYLLTNTVVTTRNVDRLPDILAWLIAQGSVRHCLLSNVAPEGRGEKDYAGLSVSVDRWRILIPKLAELAENSGVTLRVFGLPLCAFGGHAGLSNDLYWSPRVTVERAAKRGGVGLAEIQSNAPTRKRVKPPVCAPCSLRRSCAGIFSRYARTFGIEELIPTLAESHG